MAKNKAQAPTLQFVRYTSCVDLTHALVATAAWAAATAPMSRSTRPHPAGSGTVEIDTRRISDALVSGLCGTCASWPTNKNPGYGAFPPDLVRYATCIPGNSWQGAAHIQMVDTCMCMWTHPYPSRNTYILCRKRVQMVVSCPKISKRPPPWYIFKHIGMMILTWPHQLYYTAVVQQQYVCATSWASLKTDNQSEGRISWTTANLTELKTSL